MKEILLPKKSLGQHWLKDTASLQSMCDSVAIGPDDIVLEIGPGLGTLTEILTKRAAQVIAVEVDGKLASELINRVPAPNLQIIAEDILRFDFTSFPANYKIVANIPYYLSGNLLQLLSETPNRPQAVALLLQKEVAQRVAAQPGALSILAITTQFFWRVSLGQIIPANLFFPSPKVDSQILILFRRSSSLFPNVNNKLFFKLIKFGFAQRRKTLLNNLTNGLEISRDEIQKVCLKSDIDPKRRAQTLTLEEWHKLYLELHP